MIRRATVLPGNKVKLAGDLDSLLEQIGSPEIDFPLGYLPEAREIQTPEQLREFLKNYHSQILAAIELPAIARSYFHANQNECRELIALDKEMVAQAALEKFAAASQRIGRIHLERLRPLRDHRFLQRYLHAVDFGEAYGWHTLVYGLTLAIYSLPLRQGLIAYGEQALIGFARCAGRQINISETECRDMGFHFSDALASKVDALLTPGSFSGK